MAGVKISNLPAATVPLTGAELIAVVQGGATKQAAIGGTIPAAQIINTPTGTIAATNVQTAINEIVTDLSASSGSSLVGYLPAGTGATATTAQTKLRERVSVKDFGAVGNGVANDTAAIQAAVTAAGLLQKAVFFPGGTYNINASINMPVFAEAGRQGTVPLIGENSYESVVAHSGTAEAFIYPSGGGGIDQIVIEDLQIDTTTGGGIKIQDDASGLYINRFFMNGCGAGKWAINLTGGTLYTMEIVGRFWRADGYFGGVFDSTSATGILNFCIRDSFISQQRKNGDIIILNNAKNITVDTIQIEGSEATTTVQTGIKLLGYCFNLNVKNLYTEGELDTLINLGTTGTINATIDGVFTSFSTSKPSSKILDASGTNSNSNIKLTNLIYRSLATGAGTGFVVNDPSHLCILKDFNNQSTGSQASRKMKQDFDYDPRHVLFDAGFVASAGTITATLQLPPNMGSYLIQASILNADGNHQIVALGWVVFDSGFSNNFANTQRIGTTITKGSVFPTGEVFTVTTGGLVTLTATSNTNTFYKIKWFWQQLTDVVYPT
jgi:hypothetical protein